MSNPLINDMASRIQTGDLNYAQARRSLSKVRRDWRHNIIQEVRKEVNSHKKGLSVVAMKPSRNTTGTKAGRNSFFRQR